LAASTALRTAAQTTTPLASIYADILAGPLAVPAGNRRRASRLGI
jgi:hypothetical protein